MHTIRPVLLAYDGSPDARAAIRAAGHLFPGAPAVVLYAREPLEAVAAHLEGHPELEELRLDDIRALDASERVAAEGAEQARGVGLDAAPRVAATGQTAAEAIVEAADAVDAAAIVLGSRGRRGLRAAVLGSTSTAVLHRSGRPTLVVPPTPPARPVARAETEPPHRPVPPAGAAGHPTSTTGKGASDAPPAPLDPDQAPSTAATLLAGIIDRHGDAGPMVRTMAHSPALLQGYLDLSRALERAALPRPLAEKISLAVQEWIGCDYCLAAHTTAGRAVGLTDTDIDLARQGTATDAREAALITHAVRVLTEPDSITDADIAELWVTAGPTAPSATSSGSSPSTSSPARSTSSPDSNPPRPPRPPELRGRARSRPGQAIRGQLARLAAPVAIAVHG